MFPQTRRCPSAASNITRALLVNRSLILQQFEVMGLRCMMPCIKRFGKHAEQWIKRPKNLVVVVGYLRSLLDNAAVVRFLSQAEPAMLAEFQKIVDLADMKATG